MIGPRDARDRVNVARFTMRFATCGRDLVVFIAAVGLALPGCRGHGDTGGALEPASGSNLASIGLGAARPTPAFELPPGIDLTRFEQHVVPRTLSPAGVGTQRDCKVARSCDR